MKFSALSLVGAVFAGFLGLAACGGAPTETFESEDTSEEELEGACSTNAMLGLARQEIAEIRCMSEGLVPIASRGNIVLGSAALPYLTPKAAQSLAEIADANPDRTLRINSAFRTVGQQYTLFRGRGRCKLIAARPGASQHESGLALDIRDSALWREDFSTRGWRSGGPGDRMHFSLQGDENTLKNVSVNAFQRLWNRNHPEDLIAEDGLMGPETESRLARAPGGGFPVGAVCNL